MVDDSSSRPKEIRFVYEKARHHRTLHADGAWAGLTPQLEIQFAFFNNLRRLPESATHSVEDNDTLGPAVQKESADVVREVDITVVMNVVAMKATIELLTRMVEQAEGIIAQKTAHEGDKEKV